MPRVLAGAMMMMLALAAGPVHAQPAPAGQEGVYTIPQFRFESGKTMDGMKVGYVTFGQLNADKSNAVLLVPGTSALRHWADDYVGPGKMYDSAKYFFISVDAIGGGTSSQPKDGLGADFPAYTHPGRGAGPVRDGDQGVRPRPPAGGGRPVHGLVPGRGVGRDLPGLRSQSGAGRPRRPQRQPFPRLGRFHDRADHARPPPTRAAATPPEPDRGHPPRRHHLLPVALQRRIPADPVHHGRV